MRFIIAIPLFLVPMVVDLALINRLAKHRIDLRPMQSPYEGTSKIWQVNVLRRANYDAAGQKLLGWLRVWFVLTACMIWGAAILITGLW